MNLMKNTEYNQQREKNRIVNYEADSEPSRVVMILTNKCNLSCSFCFQDRKRLPGQMSTEDWMKVIDNLEKDTHITLTGGEPFVYKDFKEIFIKACLNNKVNIISNGVLVNSELVDLLLSKKNFKVLSISIDTIGNVNRKVKTQQYNMMKSNLNYFIENRNLKKLDTILDTKTVVTDENAKDLFNIYLHCKNELKSDTHSFQFLKGSEIQHSDKMFSFEEILKKPKPDYYKNSKIIAEQFDKVREYVIKNNSYCYTHPNFIDFFDSKQNYYEILDNEYNFQEFESSRYKKCMGPWESAHINADGKTFACLAVNLGDIRSFKDLKDLYKGYDAQKFRNLIRAKGTVPACHRCGYLKLKEKV